MTTTNPTDTPFHRALAGYLLPNGWRLTACPSCGRSYYGKGSPVCGSDWCPGTTPATAPAGAPHPGPAAQWTRIRRVLETRGLTPFAMPGLRGTARDTDLVVSALQYLDPVVHQGAPAPSGPMVLAQPCVRWRYLPVAGREEAVSSSFVNLSSLEVGGPALIDRLADHLDLWLDCLSAVGVTARDTTVALSDESCAYGPYAGLRADLNSGGLEIGEINWYGTVEDTAGRELTVIDCGFAFERIAWTAPRTDSYHAMLAPVFLPSGESAGGLPGGVVNDRVRTLALLSLSGVTPGSRGPRRYVRQLADELAVPFLAGVNLPSALEHAVRFWRQFTPPAAVGDAEAVELAVAAVERRATAQLARALQQPEPPVRLPFAEAAELLAARSGGRPAVRRAVDALTVAS
ncbi:hypothetical protein [Streptomyces sp. NBC_00158]|uniref:hypothetical protein n=1 Tax=Streptomyces sp. NBC_00158 TaxID=2903627 RepID=UPI0032448656